MRFPFSAMPMLVVLALTGARPARAAWGVGPLAGANFSFDDIDGRDVSTVTSWNLGARLQLGLAPVFSLMFDPMLVKSRTDFGGTLVPGRGDIITVEIPALLNARLNLANLGLYAFIGPDLVFPTDASGNVEALHDLRTGDLNTVVWAGQVGAGLAVGLVPMIDLTADARYTHGFSDLLDGAKGDIKHWRTRDVRLDVGILLHTPGMGSLYGPGGGY